MAGSGHVFHPGHQELHGITVVVETDGPHTYVGRFDSQDQRGVVMHDVGVYDASAGAASRDEYLTRAAKFGIRAEHKQLLIPGDQVVRITRFTDLVRGL
jgi:hypothetical protein